MSARQKKPTPGRLSPTPTIDANAAGIDIGATEIYIAVPADWDPQPVRKFATFTEDLMAAADWLERCEVSAERIATCYPAIEKLRFVSSGTEATMSAITLARPAAGRKLIVKFEGCYHGHADGLLVKAGSVLATFGIPGSAGVPDEIAHLTLALPYNDLATVETAFAAHPNQIATVMSPSSAMPAASHRPRAISPACELSRQSTAHCSSSMKS